MCTKEYSERLKDLKVGKTSVADFSTEEWDEYLRIHRAFMESLTLWFEEEVAREAGEHSGSTEEAVDG